MWDWTTSTKEYSYNFKPSKIYIAKWKKVTPKKKGHFGLYFDLLIYIHSFLEAIMLPSTLSSSKTPN